MICSKCQTENSADNKFCRECGISFVAADISPSREEMMRRQAKVAELLADALRLRDKGLYKEAMPFAEEASRLAPESTRALAMLTSLHEHLHQWDQAIFAMERVVALTPDSIADREKLAELRRRAHQPALPVATPQKSEKKSSTQTGALQMIVVGGVAAIVFFSCLPLMSRHQPAQTPGTQVAVSPAEPSPTPTFDPVTPLKESFAPPADGSVDPFERKRPEVAGETSPLASPTTLPSTPLRRRSVVRTAEATPMPITAIPPMPMTPPNASNSNVLTSQSGGDETTANNNGDNGFGSGERISVRPPTTSTNGTPALNPTPQSYIYIKVHPVPSNTNKEDTGNSNSAEGNSAPEGKSQSFNDTTNASERAVQDMDRARYLQGSGHYAEAIRAYQNALSSGARGEAYQGIAQSYQRMGDTESARASYKEALHAYEQERGSRPRLAQQGIAVCEAALTLLGGT